ncbi:MAG: hypothetical protein O7D34_02390 [Ignavibacteria bacterium]|nr:hypothetical protein [Ignavibacteria bacterium]
MTPPGIISTQQQQAISAKLEDGHSSPQGPLTDSDTSQAIGRGGKIIFRNGMVHLAVMKATLDSVPVEFTALDDTVMIKKPSEMEAALQTEAFDGTGTLELEILYSSTERAPGNSMIKLLLRDATTAHTIGVIHTFIGEKDTIQTVRVPLSYGNRSLRLGV